MTPSDRRTIAALASLILLQAIMLSALYAGVPPHPPVTTPAFGIGPFLGASLAVALSAIILQPLRAGVGRTLALLAALMALVSFGPQKYFDPQFALIWPAVILGQMAAVVIAVEVVRAMRGQGALPGAERA